MSTCRNCGGIVLEVYEGLFKCKGLCGQYFRDDSVGPLPKFEVLATLDRLKAHEAGIEIMEGEEGIGADKMIFADLVAKRLVSTEGLTDEMLPQVKKVQDGFRRELIEVLQGRRALIDWFSKTKTNLGLHKTKVLTILYESLEGLKDPELVELQEFCGKALETGVM